MIIIYEKNWCKKKKKEEKELQYKILSINFKTQTTEFLNLVSTTDLCQYLGSLKV